MTDLSPELKAMAQIEAALQDLADDVRARVMQWASSRFRASAKPSGGSIAEAEAQAGTTDLGEYRTLAEFYDAAAPSTDADRALVAAHWLQRQGEATDVEAQKVHSELKHLGHRVSNITQAFEALKSRKPALIMQVRKEGTTRQARKKYRITVEGKRAVERMLASAKPE